MLFYHICEDAYPGIQLISSRLRCSRDCRARLWASPSRACASTGCRGRVCPVFCCFYRSCLRSVHHYYWNADRAKPLKTNV